MKLNLIALNSNNNNNPNFPPLANERFDELVQTINDHINFINRESDNLKLILRSLHYDYDELVDLTLNETNCNYDEFSLERNRIILNHREMLKNYRLFTIVHIALMREIMMELTLDELDSDTNCDGENELYYSDQTGSN